MNRLNKIEKRAIYKHFNDNILYKWFYYPSKDYETKFLKSKFSSEEIFIECVNIIDSIKAKHSSKDVYVESLYNTLYCDFKEEFSTQTLDEELNQCICVVLLHVAVCFNEVNLSWCRTIAFKLFSQINAHSMQTFAEDMIKKLRYSELEYEDEWKIFVNDYIISQQFLSKEIENVLLSLKDDKLERENDHTNDTITARQLGIFAYYAFNITLSSNKTNISALSKFLAYMSGKNPNSIRNKVTKINLDNRTDIEDAKKIIDMIKPFDPEFAEKIIKDLN